MDKVPDKAGARPSLADSFFTTFKPLKLPTFRSLLAGTFAFQTAQQMQGVVAAWVMFEMTRAPGQVALVQTASSLPLFLLALPAGALTDIYDKRMVGLAGVFLAMAGAALLLICALNRFLPPPILLAGCLITSAGFAIFFPTWQSAMREILGLEALASGVALNATSNNVSRSIGASVGGLAVISFGVAACFAINMLLYLPMIIALVLWRRAALPLQQTSPGIIRASLVGLRYAAHSRSARITLFRTLIAAIGTSAIYAVLPFVADRLPGQGAEVFGFLLGAFGLGAVASGLLAGVLRGRLAPEASVRLYSAIQGSALVLLICSPFVWLSACATFIAGACWVTNTAMFNVTIQMRAPAWVAGRMVALFFAAVAAGIGLGSAIWGQVANLFSVDAALAGAGGLLLATPLLGWLMPLPKRAEAGSSETAPARPLPEGTTPDETDQPVLIEARYEIDPADEATFLPLMKKVRRIRERNGGSGFRLYREATAPGHWIESCLYPRWDEYEAARDRLTKAELAVIKTLNAMHRGEAPPLVRRLSQII